MYAWVLVANEAGKLPSIGSSYELVDSLALLDTPITEETGGDPALDPGMLDSKS